MKLKKLGLLAALSTSVMVSGCETLDLNTPGGQARAACAVTGIATGFAAARQNGVSDLEAGLLGLAAMGVCDYFAQQWVGQLNNNDREALSTATHQAVVGEAAVVPYTAPDSGATGTVHVVKTEQYATQQEQVLVLKDRVQTTPPLEIVNAPFQVKTSANLRGGPGTDYKIVGNLPEGSVRHVIGKVKNKNWFLVSEGNQVGTGYVFSNLVTPSELRAPETALTGEAQPVNVAATYTCKTVQQNVKLAGQSSMTSKTTKFCQKPDGSWEATAV